MACAPPQLKIERSAAHRRLLFSLWPHGKVRDGEFERVSRRITEWARVSQAGVGSRGAFRRERETYLNVYLPCARVNKIKASSCTSTEGEAHTKELVFVLPAAALSLFCSLRAQWPRRLLAPGKGLEIWIRLKWEKHTEHFLRPCFISLQA